MEERKEIELEGGGIEEPLIVRDIGMCGVVKKVS